MLPATKTYKNKNEAEKNGKNSSEMNVDTTARTVQQAMFHLPCCKY